MSSNNDHIPTVQIQGINSCDEPLNAIAKALLNAGDEDLAGNILEDSKRLDENIKRSVEFLAKDEASEAEKLIKERQYHSKSGYVGHGTLAHSIKVETSKDDMTQDVYPTATNGGYNYGQAFEFGLKNKNYPAQHPMKDSADQLEKSIDKRVDEVIQNSLK